MSKPITLYIIRHVESEANKNHGILREIADPKILPTEIGLLQGAHAGQALQTLIQNTNPNCTSLRLWTSPFNRTMATANLVRDFAPDLP